MPNDARDASAARVERELQAMINEDPIMPFPFRDKKLGYVALNVTDIGRSHDFVMKIYGLDEAGVGGRGERYYRTGLDHHSVILHPAKRAGFRRAGWQLDGAPE